MPSLPSQQFSTHSSLQFAETIDFFLTMQNKSGNFYQG